MRLSAISRFEIKRPGISRKRLVFSIAILVVLASQYQLLRAPFQEPVHTGSEHGQLALSSSSTSYSFDGSITSGGGVSSSASFEADIALGGVSGTSTSSSYKAEISPGTSLLELLVAQASPLRFERDWSDFNNDGAITIIDVASAAFVFDNPDNYWDLDGSGSVTILEIALIAFHFDQPVPGNPYPGQEQPPGVMDPSWRGLCGFLREPYKTYCQTRI